jgi:hypothetical protein
LTPHAIAIFAKVRPVERQDSRRNSEAAIIAKASPQSHLAEGYFLLFLSAKAYDFGRGDSDEF